jgi:hypothetical protein
MGLRREDRNRCHGSCARRGQPDALDQRLPGGESDVADPVRQGWLPSGEPSSSEPDAHGESQDRVGWSHGVCGATRERGLPLGSTHAGDWNGVRLR